MNFWILARCWFICVFFFLNHFCRKKDRDTSHKGRGATGTPGPPSFALALKKFLSSLIRAVPIGYSQS